MNQTFTLKQLTQLEVKMWSNDKQVHDECVAKIVAVASEPNTLKRYGLALREIATGLATLPPDTDREAWASALAMHALHPNLNQTFSQL